MAVLTAFSGAVSIYDYISAVDRVCSLAENYLGLTLTVGVGTPCAAPAGLPQSAEGAQTLWNTGGLVGVGRAIYIGDLEPDAGDRPAFDEADERALTAAVKLGGEAEIRAAVEQLVGRLRQTGPAHGPEQPVFPGAFDVPA